MQNRYTADDDFEFQSMIVRRYRNDFQCAEQIKTQLEQAFDIHLPAEELTFLTIHLHRLTLSMGIENEKE